MVAVGTSSSNAGILERLLSAPRPVILLRGPAGAGKTEAALAMYDHFNGPAPGRCLLIVPNYPSVAATGRLLLERSGHGVVVLPQIITFAGLAGRILSGGGKAARTLSPFARRLLLRRIVNDLQAAGRLRALGGVADTPGIITALDKAVAELKRGAIEPDALARAAGTGKAKTADLLEVYRRYQQHLLDSGAFDTEGLMWLARDVIFGSGEGEPPGLAGVAAAVVDGFTDFTPTQLDILATLGCRLERVLITLPHDDDGRERMWRWTSRTANQVRQTFSARLVEILLPARRNGAGIPPVASTLCERVFNFDASPCPLPSGLSLISACGIENEVAAVARRVKRLLVDGEKAGAIAVLARTMDAYRPVVDRIFARHDIPLRSAPEPLPAVPIIRFLLDTANLAGNFEFRKVLAVIRNSYFRPLALGPFDAATVVAAEAVIRLGNVTEGRQAYARAAQHLAALAARDDAESQEADEDSPPPRLLPSPRKCLEADAMLQALFDLSQSATMRGAAPPGGASGGLGVLIDRLRLRAVACEHDDPAVVGRDLRALSAMEAAIAELPSPPPSPEEFRAALSAVACPGRGGEEAATVLDVLDARAMRFRHIFLLGLNEGQFPRRFSEGSLITEADRADWGRRGVSLDTRGDLTAREMLLFYLGASRADCSLTLSFLESDSAGGAAAASNFLLSLLQPCGGLEAADAAGRVERIGPGLFLPSPEFLATPAEAFLSAVSGRFDEGRDPDARALAWTAVNAAEKVERAAWGLFARHRRWSRGPCDEFDGRITDPSLQERLAERFGQTAVFSASQLNSFAQCPWQFFARHVLGLRELPRVEDRLGPQDRGLFCHRVLFEVMSRLRQSSNGTVRLADVAEGELLAALDETVSRQSARMESTGLAYPALWQVQCRQIHERLRNYLLAQRSGSAAIKLECLNFELNFGSGQPAGADPASVAPPVALATSVGEIRFRGRIDRVDRFTWQDLKGLLVVDYKTGSLPSPGDIKNGRNVQLPLYAAVAEKLLAQQCHGGVFHAVLSEKLEERYFAAVRRSGGKMVEREGYDERFKAALDRVGQAVRNIRGGRFDLAPTGHCPSYCPFRQICHYADARAELKAPDAREARP